MAEYPDNVILLPTTREGRELMREVIEVCGLTYPDGERIYHDDFDEQAALINGHEHPKKA